ncbi:Ubiquinone biosynthesis O-methyltransferase [compost metagenome]
MKSYYHAHESAYKQLKAKGYVGWGDVKNVDELGDETTKEYLRSTIAENVPVVSGKRALDVGCGTGTTAFTLAKIGFVVTGIDISETAIQMGRDLAEQQNLDIQFVAGDVLELEKLNEKFDVIYDSHCLHCIVFEEDRSKVLAGAKKSLMDSGIFILDTMVMPEEGRYNPADKFDTLRLDENFILWHKTKPSEDRGVIEIDGQHWCAQRRIYPLQKIIDEVAAAGFKVISKRLDPQEGNVSMLRLVLKA